MRVVRTASEGQHEVDHGAIRPGGQRWLGSSWWTMSPESAGSSHGRWSETGIPVTAAGTGAEAIRLAAEDDYALVVLDLILPGASGLDVPPRRSSPTSPASGCSCSPPSATRRRRSSASRTARSTTWPSRSRWPNWSPGSGSGWVEPRTARSSGAGSPSGRWRWTCSGVRPLWTARASNCHRASSSCSTTSCSAAGQVCRRDDLLAEVWGYTFDTSSNVLDVYIRRLRTKLDPNCIETVRNAGYCFTAELDGCSSSPGALFSARQRRVDVARAGPGDRAVPPDLGVAGDRTTGCRRGRCGGR